MTFQERNLYQMEVASRFARRYGLDLLDALTRIAERFATKYPHAHA